MASRIVFRCLTALIVFGATAISRAQSGTALVRRAPTINGTVDGSLQMMSGESFGLNGGANVSGSLLVPGTPTITLNGTPSYGGTQVGSGVATPSGYFLTLNSGSTVGHVVTRTNAISLPPVSAPTAPAGTRSVTINSAGDSPGSFATLRNLTLNSSVGQFSIPAGNYGNFIANSGSGFTLGVAGATTASVYNFQSLTFNTGGSLQIIGPVIVTVANGFTGNGVLGSSTNPSWLTLNFYAGNFTLNTGSSIYGTVNAPNANSSVIINSGAQLVGSLTCDRLTINSSGLLRLTSTAPNAAPTVSLTAPANNAVFTTPTSVPLAASAADADGNVTKVEFFQGTTLLGQDTTAPYQFTWASPLAGTYTLKAVATDNVGAVTTSGVITVTINTPPTVALTAPADNATAPAPANFTLVATASDSDGTIAQVEFYNGATKLGTSTTSPYEFTWSNVSAGSYTLSAVAIDNRGATTTSTARSVQVTAPNLPPAVALTAPSNNSVFSVPGAFTLIASASDADGSVAKVEFYQGGALVGQSLTAPHQFALSGLAAGSYAFTAKATDNGGLSTTSSAVTVVVNAQPAVLIAPPPAGSLFVAPAAVTLSVNATDGDGTIAKVELYRGGNLVGTLNAPSPGTSTYLFTDASSLPPGTYLYRARSYDNFGSYTDSDSISITVLAGLPYRASYEATEGYVAGLLAGQLGWSVGQGAASVTTADFSAGTRSAVLSPGALPASVTQTFAPLAGQNVIFVEFFAKPVVATSAEAASLFAAEGARFAFVSNGSQGSLQAFNGDGMGGGTWTASRFSTPLTNGQLPATWLRLTVRLDFARKTWDLYVNGTMVAADLGFQNNAATSLGLFSVRGHDSAETLIDDLFVGAENPLFADANSNGIDDGWEVAHALSLANNNRALTPAGNGVTVLQAYLQGFDPSDYYSGQAPVVTIVSGNNQSALASALNPLPFVILVKEASGTTPLANAPVTFTVVQGGGSLLATPTATPSGATYSTRTGADGTALVYYRQPATSNTPSQIQLAAGSTQVIFQTNTLFNEIPTVALTSPVATDVFVPPATVLLRATATDLDGSVVRVDFYQGTTKLGEALTAPYELTWANVAAGSYVLLARAIDNQGGVAVSAPVTITVGQSFWPFRANFEVDENYQGGALEGQNEWSASASVVVSPQGASSGAAGVLLPASAVPSTLTRTFPQPVGQPIVFAAFNLQLNAGTTPEAAKIFDVGGARVAFVRLNDTRGEFRVFNGDGVGGGSWQRVEYNYEVSIRPDASSYWAPSFELRFDFSTKKWDLVVDGQLLAADVGLVDQTIGYVNRITTYGHATLPVTFDSFYLGFDNQSFTDADRDNIDDNWETSYGLNIAVNDRNGDLDQDDLSNIREFIADTEPTVADSDEDGLTDGFEVRYGFDPWSYTYPIDEDGDGASQIDEARNGTSPTDYFNGQTPVITIVSGEGDPDGKFEVKVHRSDGTPYVNAPVNFDVPPDEASLAGNPDSTILHQEITLRTDANGLARVYLRPAVVQP